MPDEKTHSLVQQLLPLMKSRTTQGADDLVRIWKEFLGDKPVPLKEASLYTFVYYDFSHRYDQIFLEASFSPGRKEPMTRVGTTGLFLRVFELPLPARLRYRYSNGDSPLADPFNPEVDRVQELWHRAEESRMDVATLRWIVGASEAGLYNQDLLMVLPPGYLRNLAWTYPLVVLVGLDGDGWTQTLSQLMQAKTIRPVIAVSLGTKDGQAWAAANLKATLESQVLPWVKDHYRVSEAAQDLALVGAGDSTKAAFEVAQARPDLWMKVWHSFDTNFLKNQYPTVAP